MKMRCDVCDKEEASVFCSADEAALCNGCDRRVHYANKLASKHARFSLAQPKSKEAPLCDICKERRAFLFCLEDRAILCRDCDVPIHQANEHTKGHNRFLLTGIKLTPSSNYPLNDENISSSQSSSRKKSKTLTVSVSNNNNGNFISPSVESPTPSSACFKTEDNCVSDSTASISTSSISEYLMETLPGWRVDDFLDPSAATNGFCKIGDSFSILGEQDLSNSCISSLPLEEFPYWARETSSESNQECPFYLPTQGMTNCSRKPTEINKFKATQKWRIEDGFSVPEFSPPSSMNQRHIR